MNPRDKAQPSKQMERMARLPKFGFAGGSKPLDGFTIKRGVGVGGFGEVYYATTDAGKEVALKRIQRHLEIELRGVRQCLNLKHNNLVSLYDIKYDEDGQAWVVMEYVSGESLQDVIERNPNGMPDDQVKFWFNSIAAGVAYLHDCGIVHRDLKPGNIFMDEGTVKIGDYGLSKFISCSRRSGQTQSVGTFHYMAPEIGQGTYGKEIDVYALGVMLYEMITGRVPFDGESTQEIIMKHLTATPSLDGIPQPHLGVIATALSKDPTQRTQTAAEMLQTVSGQAAPMPGVYTPPPARPQAVPQANQTNQPNRPYFAANAAAAGIASGAAHAGLPDEPIARGLAMAWRELAEGWKTSRIGTAGRIALLGGALFSVLFLGRVWAPYLLALVISYAVYYVIRSIIIGKNPDANAAIQADGPLAAATPLPPAVPHIPPTNLRDQPISRKVFKQRKRQAVATAKRQLRSALAEKTSHQHLTELTGSFFVSGIVCTMISFLVAAATKGPQAIDVIPVFGWLAMSTTLGAWSILGVSKWWEKSTGDTLMRRLTLLIAGLLVGAAVYGLTDLLAFEPGFLIDDFEGIANSDVPNPMYNSRGLPMWAGYLAFFGALFALPRWWFQTDPTRRTRFGIGRTFLCLVAAFVAHVCFPFPGGPALALVMAAAVQISAPHLNKDARRAIAGHTVGYDQGAIS